MDSTLIDDAKCDVDNEGHELHEGHGLPRLNAARKEVPIKDRKIQRDGKLRVPLHVLYNQVGRICTRRNRTIKGTSLQQHFVQRLVSTIYGLSMPLLYIQAMLFPKHFWSSAKHDKVATLGCPPISVYTSKTHPAGFASHLERARNYCTHASSSTATDDHFTSYSYDILANSSGVDSRSIARRGFRVSTANASGLELEGGDSAELTETQDSHKAMMNLAAASVRKPLDAFLTYTCNQSDHPGICHLHKWKESQEWTKTLDGYHYLPNCHKEDIKISMEMAYSHMLTRCWLEVRRFWLQFIIYSTSTMLGKVTHAFFRDEYQECSGNLSHIHGLIALDRNGMDDDAFREFICSLQKNCVADIIKGDEIDHYIKSGLLQGYHDWTAVKVLADTVLGHTCHNKRCLLRKDYTGIFELDYECKKDHPVFDCIDPLKNDFIPLPRKFSETCCNILERLGLYDPPTEENPGGTFHHQMLNPKRHMGVVHPGARENLSPVMGEHFAFTRSMQNMQVIHGTNGVTRYVVKVSWPACIRLLTERWTSPCSVLISPSSLNCQVYNKVSDVGTNCKINHSTFERLTVTFCLLQD